MTFEILTALSLFALASSITPGPNNIMLMSSGANFGFYKSLPHMLGVGLGFGFMLILVGVGMVKLFDMVPMSYEVLKIVSVLYLLYLAYHIAFATKLQTKEKSAKPLSFFQAAIFQWLNPKGWTMALTSMTVYAPSQNLKAVVVVAIIFTLVNIPSVSTWVILGNSLKKFLSSPKKLKWFNMTMASTLILSLYPVLTA